jgi:DNA-binding Lrp family transcriptional regulator
VRPDKEDRGLVSAFVLVACEEGTATGVVQDARAVSSVAAVDAVLGPYDIVMRVDGGDVHEVARAVVNEIQAIPGVIRTDTCALL